MSVELLEAFDCGKLANGITMETECLTWLKPSSRFRVLRNFDGHDRT